MGDKGFCSYFDVDQFQQLGVDSVISVGVRKPVEVTSALAVLGHNDLLIQWPKPKWNKTSSYSKEDWKALPEQLTLRQIKVVVDNPGFRVQSFYIVTTLIDVQTYSAADIADRATRLDRLDALPSALFGDPNQFTALRIDVADDNYVVGE